MKTIRDTVNLTTKFESDECNSHMYLFNDLNSLSYIGRKNPQFTNHIITLYMKEFSGRELDMFKNTLKLIIQNAPIIKNSELDVFSFDSIEILDDAIQLAIKESKALKMVKSITSNKYKKLINKEVIELFIELISHGVNHTELQSALGAKLAAYKTPEMFADAIKKVINDFSDFSMFSVIKTVNALNSSADIVYQDLDSNTLIVKINDYKASKKLGSHHWCISYSESYFNQYTQPSNDETVETVLFGTSKTNQYFIFNFDVEDSSSMIGVTIRENKMYAAHYKDDTGANLGILRNQYPYLIKIDKDILHKTSNRSLDDDMINELLCNSELKRNKKIEGSIKYIKDNDDYIWNHFDYLHNLDILAINPLWAVRFLEFYDTKKHTKKVKTEFANRFNKYWKNGAHEVFAKFEAAL